VFWFLEAIKRGINRTKLKIRFICNDARLFTLRVNKLARGKKDALFYLFFATINRTQKKEKKARKKYYFFKKI